MHFPIGPSNWYYRIVFGLTLSLDHSNSNRWYFRLLIDTLWCTRRCKLEYCCSWWYSEVWILQLLKYVNPILLQLLKFCCAVPNILLSHFQISNKRPQPVMILGLQSLKNDIDVWKKPRRNNYQMLHLLKNIILGLQGLLFSCSRYQPFLYLFMHILKLKDIMPRVHPLITGHLCKNCVFLLDVWMVPFENSLYLDSSCSRSSSLVTYPDEQGMGHHLQTLVVVVIESLYNNWTLLICTDSRINLWSICCYWHMYSTFC